MGLTWAWSYKKKKHRKIKPYSKSLQKEPTVNMCLLILDSDLDHRSKESIGKETVDISILVTSRNGDRNIMQSIRITSKPPLRIRKKNQLSQFR